MERPTNHAAGKASRIDLRSQAEMSINLAWLEERLNCIVPLLARPVEAVSITIVDDARMRSLHALHLGDDTTTDVMTFDLGEDGQKHGAVDATIVICADEAARRARERDHAIERELLLYALHGLLHCAGFDDRTEPQYAAMHAEEDRLLDAIGIGRTFFPPATGS